MDNKGRMRRSRQRKNMDSAAGVVLPPQALRALDLASGDSLSNALQKVGLALTPRKAPLEILVIDSMQKAPTNN